MKKTWYDILGVNSKAEPDAIESAFLERRNQLQDKPDPDSRNELKLVQHAYEVLSNPAERAAYDQSILPAVSRKALYRSDGMIEEPEEPGANPLKLGILAGSLLLGLAIVLNYSTDSKIIESSRHSSDRQLDNQHEFQTGIIENQSQSIANQRLFQNDTSAAANRIIDIEQQRAINQSLAITESRLRAEMMEKQRNELAARQQQAAEERQQAQEQEAERQRLMSQMISMKEWDTARGLAKTPYEISMINQQEQAAARTNVPVLNEYAVTVPRRMPLPRQPHIIIGTP